MPNVKPLHRGPQQPNPMLQWQRFHDERNAQTTKALTIASRVLLWPTIVAACVPLWGFSTWLFGAPVCIILAILAVVMLTKGAVGRGVFQLAIAMVLLPVWIAWVPFISTIVGDALHKKNSPRENAEAPAIRTKS